MGMNRGATADQTAEALSQFDASLYPREAVIVTVKEMIDAGSRYKNIENTLGKGAIFVLGTEIAETQYGCTQLLADQVPYVLTEAAGQNCYPRVEPRSTKRWRT
jgi:hypothetical protein